MLVIFDDPKSVNVIGTNISVRLKVCVITSHLHINKLIGPSKIKLDLGIKSKVIMTTNLS